MDHRISRFDLECTYWFVLFLYRPRLLPGSTRVLGGYPRELLYVVFPCAFDLRIFRCKAPHYLASYMCSILGTDGRSDLASMFPRPFSRQYIPAESCNR